MSKWAEMDIECFVEVVGKHLTKEQIKAILEEFSSADDNGHCSVCYKEDVPVDEQGKEIQGDDMENVYEYQERHEADCPIVLLGNIAKKYSLLIQGGQNYLTRDGTRASVWEWGKNGLGEECWRGTVEDGGMNCWDKDGKDLSGTTAWDLVSLKNK